MQRAQALARERRDGHQKGEDRAAAVDWWGAAAARSRAGSCHGGAWAIKASAARVRLEGSVGI